MGVMGKLRYLFTLFLGVLRRALCCFKRKLRASEGEDGLSGIVVQASDREWKEWGQDFSKPVDPIQRKIEDYRASLKQAMNKSSDKAEENREDVDYFSDIRPACADRVAPEPAFSLPRAPVENRRASAGNRLSFDPDEAEPLLVGGAELEEWNEEAECDWEVDTEVGSSKKNYPRDKRSRGREKRSNETGFRLVRR